MKKHAWWVGVVLVGTCVGAWGCSTREPAPPPADAPKQSELLNPPSVDLGTPLQRPATPPEPKPAAK